MQIVTPAWLLGVVLFCGLAPAQWISYPTPGVPKGKDGKPNPAAPAPRSANGKPDLSGMWITSEGLPCAPIITDNSGDCLEKTRLSKYAPNIGVNLPGGLPYQPWAAELAKQRAKEVDPHSRCLPSNPPRIYTLPHITKILQLPGLLVMLNEFNFSFRQIFTDGRPLPVDPQPSWYGYSTGKWEGDTLVIQSNGFRDDLWLDMAGNPLTNAAKMTERIRRPNFGRLEITVTVDDPKAYTRPWTVTLGQDIALNTELLEEICLENEQSVQHLKGALGR